ncbi:MAG: ligase-associated DNA damage response exonuclease [Pirellulales bacterium]
MPDLLQLTPAGLYCKLGDFYIDPLRPVNRAIITHAHADHARSGSDRYLCASPGKRVLHTRIGSHAPIDCLRYGEAISINGVEVSLHPAGHVLGSAQVRVTSAGQTWVVTGDYKLDHDDTCHAFDPVRCDVFVTESTFGLPVYTWPDPSVVAAEINSWWKTNQDAGKTSVIFAYALGKAQRIAALLDPSLGQIIAHGAVMKMIEQYRASGIRLPSIDRVPPGARRMGNGKAMVLAPPSAAGSRWLRIFGETEEAMASGWMLLRGIRRRRGFDRGFVISDHADFSGLIQAVDATGAKRVLVTHGFADPLARFLRERGLDADTLATGFSNEIDLDDHDSQTDKL